MTHDPTRVAHVLERLAVHDAHERPGAALCATASDVLDLPGAALMLVDGGGTVHTVGVWGPLMAVLEDLQHVHGEGPCIEAQHLAQQVAEPDLARGGPARWLGFSAPAVDAGARAAFGFPLQVGPTCIGALNLCAERIGDLTSEQTSDALVIGDIAVQTLLSAARREAAFDGLSTELLDADEHQIIVHQATGMVAARLGIDVSDAAIRLRAHAFATDSRLSEVARDIVERRVRLDP